MFQGLAGVWWGWVESLWRVLFFLCSWRAIVHFCNGSGPPKVRFRRCHFLYQHSDLFSNRERDCIVTLMSLLKDVIIQIQKMCNTKVILINAQLGKWTNVIGHVPIKYPAKFLFRHDNIRKWNTNSNFVHTSYSIICQSSTFMVPK